MLIQMTPAWHLNGALLGWLSKGVSGVCVNNLSLAAEDAGTHSTWRATVYTAFAGLTSVHCP